MTSSKSVNKIQNYQQLKKKHPADIARKVSSQQTQVSRQKTLKIKGQITSEHNVSNLTVCFQHVSN